MTKAQAEAFWKLAKVARESADWPAFKAANEQKLAEFEEWMRQNRLKVDWPS